MRKGRRDQREDEKDQPRCDTSSSPVPPFDPSHWQSLPHRVVLKSIKLSLSLSHSPSVSKLSDQTYPRS